MSIYPKTPTGKAPKGSVSIVSSNGRLQLVFRYGGKRRYVTVGLSDTPQNRGWAEGKARALEFDMLAGKVDESWASYKFHPKSSLVVNAESITTKVQPTLVELWEKYTEFQATRLQASTIAWDYRKVAKRIDKLPQQQVDEAIAIRDFLLKAYSTETARRTLKDFERCCDWAKRSGLIEVNPFSELVSDLKPVKNSRKTCKAYTAEERDAILAALENNTYCPPASNFKHSHYWGFAAFMFLTGCRPQDASALRWKHVKKDRVIFTEAYRPDIRLFKPGKTGTIRPFPINDQLRAVLNRAREAAKNHSNEDFVFPSPTGKPIDHHNFLSRVWKPVVESLVKDGRVAEYLPQNNTRHSFITACLEKGLDPKDIAPLVGNSAKVIYENYAGKKRDITIPEL